jgi:hypothetical protein
VGEGADPDAPFGVSRRRPAVRSPSPGHGPPLMRSACPPEDSPNRVAGFWLPAPPMPSARERAGLRGLSRPDYPSSRRTPGPLMGFGSPTGFPTSRSGRPVSGPTPPMGFSAPTTNTARRSGQPGFASPGTFRPQGSTLTPACSLRTASIRGSNAVPGVHPSGLDTLRPAAPVTGPLPSCRFRFSLPYPLRTIRSGAPPRLQDVTPAAGPSPSGRSCLPSGPRPSWVSVSPPKLSPRCDGPGFPRPPLMCFLVGSGRSRRRRRHSRVSIAARSGELSPAHRLP